MPGTTFTVKDSLGTTYTLPPGQVGDTGAYGGVWNGIAYFTYATAPGAITIKITATSTAAAGCLITPIVFTGQASSPIGPNVLNTSTGSTISTAEGSLVTSAAGSYGLLAGNGNGNTTMTAIAGTTTLGTWNDTTNGSVGAAGRTTSATGTPGTTTVGWTLGAPLSFGSGIVGVEILPASGSTPVAQADDAGAAEAMTLAVVPAGPADHAGAAEALGAAVTAPVPDTAGAADALTVTEVGPAADVGGAVDSLFLSAESFPVADFAGAAEAVALGVVPAGPADTVGAAEAMAISLPSPQPDVGGAHDALAVTVAAPMPDAGGASDNAANVTPRPAEAAGADDQLAVTVSAPSADTAGASDALSVSAASPVAEAGGAREAVVITVAAPMAEHGGAADTAFNATPTPAEHGGAADQLVVTVTDPTADTGAAHDSLFVTAVSLPMADRGGAKDSLAVPFVTSFLTDEGAAHDVPVAGRAGGSGTMGGVLPGAVLSQENPPGYQGGPSGSASVPPSALGNAWEIIVRDAADYNRVLAVVPQYLLLNFQFARQLNDVGSGSVILSMDAPWWTLTLPNLQPAEYLLDAECLWQVCKDGTPRFEFLGETVTEQLVDPSEQRQVTITGPGTMAVLKWAMVAPQGFPDIVLKLDGLLDSFDEVDDTGASVIDTNIWTTLSPADHIYSTPIPVIYNYPEGAGYALSTLYPSGSLTVEAGPATTFLGAAPYDATDTLISAQITPIGVSSSSTDSTDSSAYGSGLNGSELTQFYIESNYNPGNYALIGLSATAFYGQVGTGGAEQTKVFPAYDSSAHQYWMITEQGGTGGGAGTFYFYVSSDGQSWDLLWQLVHSWDATNVTFFVSSFYSVDKTQSVVLSNLNGNVTTPSYQGSIYLGQPMMGVWYDQFAKAQARGTIPFVTSLVNGTADSYGRRWTDTQNVQATNGTDLYSFLQGAASVVNADYVMDPGFQLRMGMPATGQVALGVDRSGYIVLREGYDSASKQRVRARDSITTLLGGENSDGHEISASSPTYIAQWGQREGWFQTSAQVDPVSMAYATAASLGQNETEVLSWSFSIVPNLPGRTIFDDFDVGDWLGIENPDFSGVQPVRVMGIAVSVDSTGAETHELTFVSYMQWIAEQLQYISNKLGGSFVNTQGTTPVAPSKYGTGQVPTYFTPAATLQGLSDVSANASTSAQTNAPLVYNSATGQYQAAGSTDPVSGQAVPATVSSPFGSASVTDTSVIVISGNGSTVIGLQPDGGVTTVDSGGTAPPVPDAPAVTGLIQAVSIAWDGLLAGSAPPSTFKCVQVYVAGTSGFTPTSANMVGTFTAAGTMTVSGLTAGATYYVKMAAVSTSGAVSGASAQVSAVSQQMPTAALTGQLPASLLGNSAGSALNPNPYFNGGDLTGWTVVNGSLISTASVPAGAPGHAQFVARIISTSAACVINGSTAPFPVTPGQPYSCTAWVYNPGGSSVTVAIGFNWTSGTTSVTIPPVSWSAAVTVQTCPPGVTSAYQVIGPTASGVTVYVVGVVAAGQVPGQLIAANSVAAAQIAANTITAGQIAANTISAAQIAANTITAGQIAANTITAAQIAANTITAAQITAGTITATQIHSGTVIAGVVNGTTIMGATIIADGSSGEFLVYAGTPAHGNLVASISAVSGTDPTTNPYDAGIAIYGSNGSQVHLYVSGSAAVVEYPSGGASEAAPARTAMTIFNQGAANEYTEMRFAGPQSSFDSSGVNLILDSSAADGSQVATGVLESGTSSSATWGPSGATTYFAVTHQLLVGGATSSAQLATSGDVHIGGILVVGNLNGATLPLSTVSSISAAPGSPSSGNSAGFSATQISYLNGLGGAVNGLITRLQTLGLIS